jgi:ABC-type phosphate transport system substrate-binding protein
MRIGQRIVLAQRDHTNFPTNERELRAVLNTQEALPMLKRTHVSCPSLLVSCLLILLAWPVVAEAQALKLDGTATCFRALREISEQYRNEHGGPEFEIRYGGPFAAVERLANREIDIGVVEFPLVRHVDRAWAKAFPKGGSTDPAAQLLREKLGGTKPLRYRPQADSQRVILAVARDRAGIGFIDLSRLSPHEKSVRSVPVRVREQPGAPLSEQSPLSRAMVLYLSPAAGEAAKGFFTFLTECNTSDPMPNHGIVPPRQPAPM